LSLTYNCIVIFKLNTSHSLLRSGFMVESKIDDFSKKVTVEFHRSLDTRFHKGLITKDIFLVSYIISMEVYCVLVHRWSSINHVGDNIIMNGWLNRFCQFNGIHSKYSTCRNDITKLIIAMIKFAPRMNLIKHLFKIKVVEYY